MAPGNVVFFDLAVPRRGRIALWRESLAQFGGANYLAGGDAR